MAHIIVGHKHHAMVRLDPDFTDPTIVNTHIEPSIRLNMKCTTYEITNEICMANDDFVLISPSGSLEICLECLVSLPFPSSYILFRYVFEVLILSESRWDTWDAFPQQIRLSYSDSRKFFGDPLRGFERSSQTTAMDDIDRKQAESFRCKLCLF